MKKSLDSILRYVNSAKCSKHEDRLIGSRCRAMENRFKKMVCRVQTLDTIWTHTTEGTAWVLVGACVLFSKPGCWKYILERCPEWDDSKNTQCKDRDIPSLMDVVPIEVRASYHKDFSESVTDESVLRRFRELCNVQTIRSLIVVPENKLRTQYYL